MQRFTVDAGAAHSTHIVAALAATCGGAVLIAYSNASARQLGMALVLVALFSSLSMSVRKIIAIDHNCVTAH